MDLSQVLGIQPRAAASTPSPADQFLQLVSDPFHSQVQQTAVLASLATSLAISGVVAVLFCFARPYNAIVYAPRLKHADEKHAPPPLGKSPWAWFGPVWRTTEQELVDKVGLDATIFIRFTKMCRNIFLVLSVMGCGILIPVNVIGGKQFNGVGNISSFMKMTPQFMIGSIYWALVACSWVIDIVVCFFLYINYRAVTRLRREYFESADYQNSLHARTLMVCFETTMSKLENAHAM
jgi:hypothetical protein